MFVACDISGETKEDKYWVLGSVWIPKNKLSQYEKEVCEFRIKNKLWGELKWGKADPQKLGEYKEFSTLSFQKFSVEFICILVNKQKVDIRSFHSNQGKMLSKFYWFLITHHIKRMVRKGDMDLIAEFNVLIDEEQWIRDENLNLKHWLQQYLKNAGLDHKKIAYLAQCDSFASSLLQACDLVTGAINARIKNNPLPDKHREIVKHLENIFGCPLLPTLPNRRGFNVWLWRPSKRIS